MSVERGRHHINWIDKGLVALFVAGAIYWGATLLDNQKTNDIPPMPNRGYDPLDCVDVNQSFGEFVLKPGQIFPVSSIPIYIQDSKIMASGEVISGEIRDETRSPVRRYYVEVAGRTETDSTVEYQVKIAGECINPTATP